MNSSKSQMIESLNRAFTGIAEPGVVVAYLFGSNAEERAHRESDIDIGVLLRYDLYPSSRIRFDQRLELISRLGRLLHQPIDLVILNDAPAMLARRIVTSGIRVFVSDVAQEHAFIRDVQLRAADLEPFLRRMRALKLQAIRR
jgi:predicted nucleotidyltransferase